MKKPPFEPFIYEHDSERWWKFTALVGLSWNVLWWTFPWMIPVRFGRWLFVSLGLMGCAGMPGELTLHEEKHCQGFSHPIQKNPILTSQWFKARPASLKPWVYVYVEDTDDTCRILGADPTNSIERIQACSIWKPANCIIILPR